MPPSASVTSSRRKGEPRLGGTYQWEVRVDLPSLRDTLEFASRLESEGIDVRRHWKYLLVGAPTRSVRPSSPSGSRRGARGLAGPGGNAPGAPHPVFLYIEAHKPGIARDLGL